MAADDDALIEEELEETLQELDGIGRRRSLVVDRLDRRDNHGAAQSQ